MCSKGSCSKKKWTNFGTFPKGGRGGWGPMQSKRSTFCHRQVPTRISFILPHIHGGASLFIPHKLYPWTLTMCWVIKKIYIYIKCLYEKCSQVVQSTGGEVSRELWECSKVSLLFFCAASLRGVGAICAVRCRCSRRSSRCMCSRVEQMVSPT